MTANQTPASTPKTTVLMGKGKLAVQVAQWFHDSPAHHLAYVVPVIPEPTWTDSLKDWADANGVPVVASGHYRDLPEPEGGQWPLVMSVFYDKIIRQKFIDKCTRILNLHNGPLPKYRGVSPINWALKNNEPSHGVTIHEILAGVDNGPVVAQVRFSIHPDIDEVRDVYGRCLAFGWELFRQTAPRLDQIPAVPQDEAAATFYHSRDNHLLGERRYFTRAESV